MQRRRVRTERPSGERPTRALPGKTTGPVDISARHRDARWLAAGAPVQHLAGSCPQYRVRRRNNAEAGRVVTSRQTDRRLVASNKRARHDYTILKTYEAGIKLVGTEVKSLREGRASLTDAFAQERDGEIMLYGLHIAEYGYGTWTNHQPRRTRKLLLHRVEIDRILEKVREGGVTLVPLSLYFANGWAKVELALARGRKSWDKRQALAERDANREIAREMGRRLKGVAGRRSPGSAERRAG